ncbi:MAG: 30S ribosomal protein S3 [Actinomycetia bacterium]|nr:30S ribosomal protein S3 [Actinomycetes bacterium]
MGQKIHPKGLRLGIIKDWDSRWYGTRKTTPALLLEDRAIRQHIKKKHYNAGISRVEIERGASNRLRITVHTGKPGMVIGKGGVGVEALRKELEALTKKSVNLNVVEVKNPETDAQLVAESVASQLEKRISFKRAMKQAVQRAMRQNARGIKVAVAGRLGGAEIARREWTWEGSIPLHTLRADIDYGFAEAHTTYGVIGVKVWIYKGQVLPGQVRRRPAAEGSR